MAEGEISKDGISAEEILQIDFQCIGRSAANAGMNAKCRSDLLGKNRSSAVNVLKMFAIPIPEGLMEETQIETRTDV